MHVPFCLHKCHYCDFYSIVETRGRQAQLVHRLGEEIAAAAAYFAEPLETIFVGGGTPTLLERALWEPLLASLAPLPRRDDLEFTVEANPETVEPELLETLVAGGVNRLSIGAQTFDRRHLVTLERWHEPANVGRSVELARAAGIVNVSLDLIFAIPGQTLDDWRADLDAALALEPTHVSCYGLTYEPNTPLTVRMQAGEFARVDQEIEAAMYAATVERLHAEGFEHYEISNWARPGRRCRHNLVYWNDRQWWPFGPSASGHVGGWRWKNVARLGEYLDHGPFPPVVDAERTDDDTRVGETFMLGLRLVDGLEQERVEDLLERGDRGPERRAAITRHLDGGLLEHADGRLRLTTRGLLLADSVLCELV